MRDVLKDVQALKAILNVMWHSESFTDGYYENEHDGLTRRVGSSRDGDSWFAWLNFDCLEDYAESDDPGYLGVGTSPSEALEDACKKIDGMVCAWLKLRPQPERLYTRGEVKAFVKMARDSRLSEQCGCKYEAAVNALDDVMAALDAPSGPTPDPEPLPRKTSAWPSGRSQSNEEIARECAEGLVEAIKEQSPPSVRVESRCSDVFVETEESPACGEVDASKILKPFKLPGVEAAVAYLYAVNLRGVDFQAGSPAELVHDINRYWPVTSRPIATLKGNEITISGPMLLELDELELASFSVTWTDPATDQNGPHEEPEL